MGQGNWYDEMQGHGPSGADQGLAGVQGGLDRLYQHVAPIQAKNEDRAYQEKLAGQERARQETELNRPVAAPVQDLLNSLREKVSSAGMPGAYAAKLYKLFQAGQLTQEQVLGILQETGGESAATQVPPPPPGPVQGPPVSPPGMPVGGPPLSGPPVTAPPSINAMNAAPMQSPAIPDKVPAMPSDATRQRFLDNAPGVQQAPPPVTPVQQPPVSAAPRQTQTAPPPVTTQQPHKWTNRDVKDLNNAGGYSRPKEKSELEIAVELLKNQTKRDIASDNNQVKVEVTDAKIQQDKKKLAAQVDSWEKNRNNAWAIAMAQINALKTQKEGSSDAKRDETLLKDARSGLKTLRDNDTKLRVSLGALISGPAGAKVRDQIRANEDLIAKAEAELKVAEERVKVRDGQKPASTTSSTTEKTPANPVPAGVKTSADFLNLYGG